MLDLWGAIFIFLLLLEFLLRTLWGFGKMPLYAASTEWEYMTMPEQSGRRLGNSYYFNRYGMRSEEVDSTKKHVLGLGNSVINGGVQTDQDSLATSIFSVETGIQMLNVSAGIWGPDNCAAYLRHYCLFDAKVMFLLVSSHDAHDIMDFKPVVGVSESYPDKQYCCAIVKVLCRYIYPRYIRKYFIGDKKVELDPDQKVLAGVGIDKNGKGFNPGFVQLKQMADSAKIPLVVFLHADAEECKDGKYNSQGWEIIRWCEANHIKFIKDLDCGFNEADYRDGIHINALGQRKLAKVIEKAILGMNGLKKQ